MKLSCDLSLTSLVHRRRIGAPPVLDLNFATQTYRADGVDVPLDAVLTFSRASSAMYVTPTGALQSVAADVLRFDHDPVTLAPRGALFESAATNMLTYSQDFAHSFWTGYALKPPFVGGATAPDGTATAMTWNCADTPGGAGGKRGGILTVDATHTGLSTVSVWLRASAPLTMRFGHSDGTSQTITVPTKWTRFTYTETLPNTQNRIFMLYEDVNDDIDVYIWGAQTEMSATASSYIATNGGPATRAADLAGLTGLTGTHDVTITYDDNSTQTLSAQTLVPGWWPTLSRPWVKKLVVV